LRFAEDRATLIELFGPTFVHIHVTASTELRKQRYLDAGGSELQFQSASNHPVESGIWELEPLANEVIVNDATLEQFRASLEAAIVRATSKKRKDPKCPSQ
jgi:hypothetical protein